MNRSGSFLLGAMAYTLLTFPLAYVWHLVVFRDVYDRLGYFNREEPIITLAFFVILLQGLLLSFAYSRFYRGGSPARQGLRFGLLAGLFLWSSQVVVAAAKHQVTSIGTYLGIETLYFAIQFALVGIAIGRIHGRVAAPAAAAGS